MSALLCSPASMRAESASAQANKPMLDAMMPKRADGGTKDA